MKQKKKNPVLLLLFLAALAVFAFALFKIFSLSYGYQKEDAVYQELRDFTNFDEAVQTPAPAAEEPTEIYVSPVDFNGLWEQNPDTIAWIYFENVDINYPVVQGEDDDFYLHHGFYKEETNCGCIFMDTESAPDFSSDNSFLYGHNMKDKSMFAKLNQYEEEDFFLENPTFLIYTPTETRRYEIYSCYPAKLGQYSFTYSFADQTEYADWQAAVKGYSLYDTGVTPDASQKTVTLMTCTPRGSSYRFLVHARLME